jgi:hypothetical protein
MVRSPARLVSRSSWRIVAAAVACVYSWWILAGLRTVTVGNHAWPRLIVAGLLLTLWACTLPFIGQRLADVSRRAPLLFLAALAAAILWATAEEQLLQLGLPSGHRQLQVVPGSGAAPVVVYDRWWPFPHHAIVYSPQVGWIGTD